jgi:hypothetical protein
VRRRELEHSFEHAGVDLEVDAVDTEGDVAVAEGRHQLGSTRERGRRVHSFEMRTTSASGALKLSDVRIMQGEGELVSGVLLVMVEGKREGGKARDEI